MMSIVVSNVALSFKHKLNSSTICISSNLILVEEDIHKDTRNCKRIILIKIHSGSQTHLYKNS